MKALHRVDLRPGIWNLPLVDPHALDRLTDVVFLAFRSQSSFRGPL